MLRITRLLKFAFFALATLLAIYFSVAVVLSLIPTNLESIQCEKNHVIFVSSNGVHLDLIIPRDLLSQAFLEELQPPDWVKYLAVGWGDREFYINTPTWNDLKAGTALRALLVNSESVIHVAWLDRVPSQAAIVALCEFQTKHFMSFVENSFLQGEDNGLIRIEMAGYTLNDKFYQAVGSFNCIRTCNQWVNQSLKTAQVKTSIWSPFDWGVLYHLR